jgi:hypothetical protein
MTFRAAPLARFSGVWYAKRMLRASVGLAFVLGSLVAACQEPDAHTGALQVQVSVNAAARVVEDTDGFFLALDGGTPQHIAVVDSLSFAVLSVGQHRVDLTDVRPTCSVNPPSPYFVQVERDTQVQVLFLGSCH